MARRNSSDAYARIYRAVRKIPRSKVATYGQVAEIAGLAGHARQVGYALHATPDEVEIPWQRVVNAKGEISARVDPLMEGVQRGLLEAEGVQFDANGRIDLARYQWQPRLQSAGPKSAGLRANEKAANSTPEAEASKRVQSSGRRPRRRLEESRRQLEEGRRKPKESRGTSEERDRKPEGTPT